jgi:hypothetical protein
VTPRRSIRYPGGLPDSQDYIDFPKLAAALRETYRISRATCDDLSAYAEYQQAMLAEQYPLDAEYAGDIGEELQSWN